MLLLPAPKGNPEEIAIELGDEDVVLVLVDEPHAPLAPAAPVVPVVPAVPVSRLSSPLLARDLRAQDDVASSCAASIAAEATRARAADRFAATLVPPPATTNRRMTVPPPSSSSGASWSRLPPVKAPPLFGSSAGEAPSFDPPTLKLPALSDASARSTLRHQATASSSVSPVSVPAKAEPTIVVVRGRPRSAWIVGSAMLGAAAALVAMRLVTASQASPARATPVEPRVVAAEPSAPSLPLSPLPSIVTAPAPTSATVVRFDEDQAVSIALAPASTSSAPPKTRHEPARTAAKPAAPTAQPLPESAPSLSGTPKLTESAPPPTPPARRKPLTPEQELAEAQLKASMK